MKRNGAESRTPFWIFRGPQFHGNPLQFPVDVDPCGQKRTANTTDTNHPSTQRGEPGTSTRGPVDSEGRSGWSIVGLCYWMRDEASHVASCWGSHPNRQTTENVTGHVLRLSVCVYSSVRRSEQRQTRDIHINSLNFVHVDLQHFSWRSPASKRTLTHMGGTSDVHCC